MGYCYEEETGFYYVSSRYYDPEVGRFINADAAIGQIGNAQSYNMYAYAFNNPVRYSDPNGDFPVIALGTVAKFVVAAVGAVIAYTTAKAVTKAVTKSSSKTKTIARTTKKKSDKGHTVYKLVDAEEKVQYVGRTKNLDARKKAHKANPARASLRLEIIEENLSYEQARGVEQAFMLYHHTINTKNAMNNQINGISPRNVQIDVYMKAAEGALGYAWNQVSNEVLYWTGN